MAGHGSLGAHQKPTRARRRPGASLREQLRASYAGATGNDTPRERQLDLMEDVAAYLARVQRRSGDRITRSVPQIARGLGWPVGGLSVRQVRDKYENRLTNTLRYLQLAGIVAAVERDLRRPDGQGIGIAVELAPGAAETVRGHARPARRAPAPRRSFSSADLSPPRGGAIGGDGLSKPLAMRKTSTPAGRASAPSTRAGPLPRARVAAALDRANDDAAGWEGASGAELVRAAPELADAPLGVLAREAWHRAGHHDGRLSPRMREQMLRSAGQVERCGYSGLLGPAASRAAVLDLAAGDWASHWWTVVARRGGDSPPRTLGGLAFCLRRLGRSLKTGARARRARAPVSPTPTQSTTQQSGGSDR